MLERRRTLSGADLVVLALWGLYIPFTVVLYGRQRRWTGVAGWLLATGGVVALGIGLGDAFAWAGLVFVAVSLFGGLLVATDFVMFRRSTAKH